LPYYTLISRPKREPGEPVAKWAPQFGAHDRATVVAERLDMKATDRRNDWATEYRIIRTANARGKTVREALAGINAAAKAPA
jgi:hypothetical protein